MAILNKCELKYLAPLVLFYWGIEKEISESKGYWDGNPMLPVSIDKMTEKLIAQGYLKNVSLSPNKLILRATEKARNLKCKSCHRGKKLNEHDWPIGECSVCSGIGLVNSQECNE